MYWAGFLTGFWWGCLVTACICAGIALLFDWLDDNR